MKYIFIPRWIEIFYLLYKGIKVSRIWKHTNCTYQYPYAVIKELEFYGLIYSLKSNRIKKIIITEQGLKLIKNIEPMLKLLSKMGVKSRIKNRKI